MSSDRAGRDSNFPAEFQFSQQPWLDSLPPEARDSASRTLSQVADHLLARRLELFVGAGMSRASGVPLAHDLARKMVSELLGSPLDPPKPSIVRRLVTKYGLEIIAEAYQHEATPGTLHRLLSEQLADKPVELHSGHHALEYLVSSGYLSQVFTTNFEDLLERSLGTRARPVTDSNLDQIGEYRRANLVPVVHINGTTKTALRITETLTYSLDRPVGQYLRAAFVTSNVLFVGYELADLSIRGLFLHIREMLKQAGSEKRPYVAQPLLTRYPAQEFGLVERLWHARGAAFLPGRAEHLLPALAAHTRRAKASRLVTRILSKKGLDPSLPYEVESLWHQAEELARRTRLGDAIAAVESLADHYDVSEAPL